MKWNVHGQISIQELKEKPSKIGNFEIIMAYVVRKIVPLIFISEILILSVVSILIMINIPIISNNSPILSKNLEIDLDLCNTSDYYRSDLDSCVNSSSLLLKSVGNLKEYRKNHLDKEYNQIVQSLLEITGEKASIYEISTKLIPNLISEYHLTKEKILIQAIIRFKNIIKASFLSSFHYPFFNIDLNQPLGFFFSNGINLVESAGYLIHINDLVELTKDRSLIHILDNYFSCIDQHFNNTLFTYWDYTMCRSLKNEIMNMENVNIFASMINSISKQYTSPSYQSVKEKLLLLQQY